MAQKNKKILIIEDEFLIGELYVRSLNKEGYVSELVIDGAEALKKAQTNEYDIILLDLMLPNLDGVEILKTLKNPSLTPGFKAKIIITTNIEERKDIKKAIEKEADGYVIKADITPSELVTLVNSVNDGQ